MQRTCKHIKSSGARCRAVALETQPFCFWHARIHRSHVEASRDFPSFYNPDNCVKYRTEDADADDNFSPLRANYPISNELPPLEDPESIQISISLILRALADSRIQHKQAALMLYALQIAANNVRAVKPAIEDSVPHIVRTDEGIEIAVDSEEPETPQSTAPPALEILSKPPAPEAKPQLLEEAA